MSSRPPTPLIPQNAASRLIVTSPHIKPFLHKNGGIIFLSLCCILNLLNSIGGLHGRQYDFWNHPTDIGNNKKVLVLKTSTFIAEVSRPNAPYTGLNICLLAPHNGHFQVSGNSSKGTSFGILLFLQPFSEL